MNKIRKTNKPDTRTDATPGLFDMLPEFEQGTKVEKAAIDKPRHIKPLPRVRLCKPISGRQPDAWGDSDLYADKTYSIYTLPFVLDGKKTVSIGINFFKETRNIEKALIAGLFHLKTSGTIRLKRLAQEALFASALPAKQKPVPRNSDTIQKMVSSIKKNLSSKKKNLTRQCVSRAAVMGLYV